MSCAAVANIRCLFAWVTAHFCEVCSVCTLYHWSILAAPYIQDLIIDSGTYRSYRIL